jgi:hypothetical protein
MKDIDVTKPKWIRNSNLITDRSDVFIAMIPFRSRCTARSDDLVSGADVASAPTAGFKSSLISAFTLAIFPPFSLAASLKLAA